jgi:hypothetical protein
MLGVKHEYKQERLVRVNANVIENKPLGGILTGDLTELAFGKFFAQGSFLVVLFTS